MKTYKSILTFSLVLGSLGSSGCNLHTQQEFEKFAYRVSTAKPVVTVFTSNLKKLIPRK